MFTKSTLKKYATLAFFLVALTAALFFSKQPLDKTEEETLLNQAVSTHYSWQVFNTTSWQINPNNQLNTQGNLDNYRYIQADAIQYREKDEITHFINPDIILKSEKTLYSLTSKEATVSQKHILNMKNNAIIKALQVKPYKTLKSNDITYNSELELLTSPVNVTFTQGNTLLSGSQFTGYLNVKDYLFLERVHTRFTPDNSPNKEHN